MSRYLVTLDELLMGREQEYPLTPDLYSNAVKLLVAINFVRARYAQPLAVSSGYRPGVYNKKAGGSPNSAHATCEAIDIADRGQPLSRYLSVHAEILEELDLYMEHPKSTPIWCHLDIRPRRARIFFP